MKHIEREMQRTTDVFRARELATAIALMLSLLVTYKLWNNASRTAEQALQTAFDFEARESVGRIQQRLLIYQQVLRATKGFFIASDEVSRADFRTYVNALDLAQTYPGIEGIGYAVVVSPSQKAQHVSAMHREGFPDYRIKPEGRRDFYTSIIYLEPFSGRNLRAFGYDMYSEPVRRAAMEQARDTGDAAMSGKVTLVQETDSHPQAGFLVYLPVYRKGAPTETIEERRRNLLGWVYAPFRMDDFMAGVNGERSLDLDIEIYDDGIISDATKMYDIERNVSAVDSRRSLRRLTRIESGGHTWTIATTALPSFERRTNTDRPLIILQAGIGISLMIALLVWLFLDDRARAFQAADQALQLALYDALTGLPNRKLLDERLKQALAEARRNKSKLALLFIDLDKFKPVNDHYGHAYGDLLLKEVARRLQSCMRESDTASRLGGDEFVALLSDIDEKDAVLTVAHKILQQLNLPYEIAGHTFEISASIGAALYPDDGLDGKALMKSADLAMYDAKNSGRANVKLAGAR